MVLPATRYRIKKIIGFTYCKLYSLGNHLYFFLIGFKIRLIVENLIHIHKYNYHE